MVRRMLLKIVGGNGPVQRTRFMTNNNFRFMLHSRVAADDIFNQQIHPNNNARCWESDVQKVTAFEPKDCQSLRPNSLVDEKQLAHYDHATQGDVAASTAGTLHCSRYPPELPYSEAAPDIRFLARLIYMSSGAEASSFGIVPTKALPVAPSFAFRITAKPCLSMKRPVFSSWWLLYTAHHEPSQTSMWPRFGDVGNKQVLVICSRVPGR